MPAELRAGTDHPLADAMCQLVERSAGEDGHVMIGVSELATTLSVENKDGPKLTAGQSRKVCETAAYAGYALEPDARLTGKAYRDDEVVAVFLRTTDDEPDPIRYGAAACMVRVGIMIAAADGEIHEQETAVLMQQVRQAFELSDVEQRRLEALRSLLERHPPDWSSLRQMAKAMTAPQREATGRLMLALVAADGVVTDDELKAIRKGYGALGLGRDEAEAAIASLSAKAAAGDASTGDDDAPTIVPAVAAARPGEQIPPPKPAVGLRLDRAAIAAIMSDTREVAKMLAAAMQAGPDDLPTPDAVMTQPVTSPPPVVASADAAQPDAVSVDPAVVAAAAAPDVTTTDDPTLPARYAAFYRLLMARGRWELKQAESLAREQGHMLAGAVEALNEWAFEKYGGQLFVEENGGLLVEKDLLN